MVPRILLCLTAWFGWWCAGAAEVEAVRVAVLDPLALENACACVKGFAQRDYAVLGRHLESATGRPMRLAFGFELASTTEKLGAAPHLLIGKTSVLIEECQAASLAIRPLARLTDLKGTTTLRGIFVVRNEDRAQGLADLAGRTILFGETSAEEKHGAALRALAAAGIPAPRPMETRPVCTQAAGELLDEKADAAVISEYALPLLVGCETMEEGALRVIGHTGEVPFITVFATSLLPRDLEPALTAALLRVKSHPELCRKLESRDGFVPWGQEVETNAAHCHSEAGLVTRSLAAEPAIAGYSAPSTLPSGWTDWRGGPRRDGFTPALTHRVPRDPDVAWRRPLEGQSLGGLTATASRVIVSDKSADETHDLWRCFSAASGDELWRVQYPARSEMDYTSAPRACPVMVGDSCFLLGALGHLRCVSLEGGTTRWAKNLIDFGGEVPVWGFCGTPLPVEGLLIVQTTAPEAALVALRQLDGTIAWKSPGRPPGYGSLLLAELGGRRQIVGFDEMNLCGWDPATGQRLWEVAPENANDFNVPTPVVVNGRLLVATENNGTRLFAFGENGIINPKPVASNADLSPVIATPVVAHGWIWGSTDDGLWALDPARQLQTVWHSQDELLQDSCSLIAGPDAVLAASRRGTLFFFTVPASPQGQPSVAARWTVFPEEKGAEPDLWSHPALAGGRLFLRSASELVCLKLPRE